MIARVIRFKTNLNDFDYSYYIAKAANDNNLRGQSLVLDETNMRIDIEGKQDGFDHFVKIFENFPLKDKIEDLSVNDGEIRNFSNFEMKKVKVQGAKKSSKNFLSFIKDLPDIFKTKLS